MKQTLIKFLNKTFPRSDWIDAEDHLELRNYDLKEFIIIMEQIFYSDLRVIFTMCNNHIKIRRRYYENLLGFIEEEPEQKEEFLKRLTEYTGIQWVRYVNGFYTDYGTTNYTDIIHMFPFELWTETTEWENKLSIWEWKLFDKFLKNPYIPNYDFTYLDFDIMTHRFMDLFIEISEEDLVYTHEGIVFNTLNQVEFIEKLTAVLPISLRHLIQINGNKIVIPLNSIKSLSEYLGTPFPHHYPPTEYHGFALEMYIKSVLENLFDHATDHTIYLHVPDADTLEYLDSLDIVYELTDYYISIDIETNYPKLWFQHIMEPIIKLQLIQDLDLFVGVKDIHKLIGDYYTK